MKIKNLAVIPAVLTLSACSSGSTGSATGTSTSSQKIAQLLTLPTAEGQPTSVQTVEGFREIASELSEGDSVIVPLSAFDPSLSGTATAVVGKSIDGLTTLTTALDDEQGFVERGITISSDLTVDVSDDSAPESTVYSEQTFTINNAQIVVKVGGYAETDYAEMFTITSANNSYTDAQSISLMVDGTEVAELSVNGSDAFVKPTGQYGFTGKAIVVAKDKPVSGDATLTANFDTNIGNVVATNLVSADDSTLSASFEGDFKIDTTSGHYTGAEATIISNGVTYDAAVVGTFNGDATQSSGAVFGIEDIPTGMFSVVREPSIQ